MLLLWKYCFISDLRLSLDHQDRAGIVKQTWILINILSFLVEGHLIDADINLYGQSQLREQMLLSHPCHYILTQGASSQEFLC